VSQTLTGKPLLTLQDCLKTFMEDEHVTDKECDWCKQKTVHKQEFVAQLKDIIIISLRRYNKVK
jgi:ubiquitin C-terminal hydrolase